MSAALALAVELPEDNELEFLLEEEEEEELVYCNAVDGRPIDIGPIKDLVVLRK